MESSSDKIEKGADMRRSKVLTGGVAALATLGVLAAPTVAHAQADASLPVVVSPVPVSWTPHILDGAVNAIAVVGSTTVVGGTFTQVQPAAGGAIVVHPYIAAFDSTTGALIPGFAPTLDGEVKSLDVVGSTVVVGGAFAHVNGVANKGITRLNVTDGTAVAGFAAKLGASGKVNSVAVRGNLLYVGGGFSNINGVARNGLAVLDATTGAVGPLNLPVGSSRSTDVTASVTRVVVSPDGTTLIVGGNFQTIGGQSRNQLALVNLTTSTVSSWATSSLVPICAPTDYTDINDIGYSPDGRYFVIATTGGPHPGTLCDTATRWESGRLGAGQLPTWIASTGGDSLTSIAATGSAVYVGGHQRWLNNSGGSNSAGPGAVSRVGIGGLDPVSGVPLEWNPSLTRFQGVGDLLATPTGLWVGYDADQIGGLTRPRIAFLPTAGGQTILGSAANELPGQLIVARPNGSLSSRVYSGSVFGTASAVPHPGSVPWGSVVGAFSAAGRVFYGTSDGKLWAAPFDGTTVGAAVDTGSWFSFAGVLGMTYDNGRLYFVTPDGALHYRLFSQSNALVGSQDFIAAATGFAGTSAPFVGGTSLYYVKLSSHTLWRVALTLGVPTGVSVQVSGPGVDALSWDATAAFLRAGATVSVPRTPGRTPLPVPPPTGPVVPHQPIP